MSTHAASAASAASAPATPKPLDSTMVGEWVGVVRVPGSDVRVQLTIAPSGAVQARIGERPDSGVARTSVTDAGRLILRFPGDLEAPNPPGMNRETRNATSSTLDCCSTDIAV